MMTKVSQVAQYDYNTIKPPVSVMKAKDGISIPGAQMMTCTMTAIAEDGKNLMMFLSERKEFIRYDAKSWIIVPHYNPN